MVSTHLKNISQIGHLPQMGMNIEKKVKQPPSKSRGLSLIFEIQPSPLLAKPRHGCRLRRTPSCAIAAGAAALGFGLKGADSYNGFKQYGVWLNQGNSRNHWTWWDLCGQLDGFWWIYMTHYCKWMDLLQMDDSQVWDRPITTCTVLGWSLTVQPRNSRWWFQPTLW